MRTVGLKVLKNRLAEYVRIAAAGERVLEPPRRQSRLDGREAQALFSRRIWMSTLASAPEMAITKIAVPITFT